MRIAPLGVLIDSMHHIKRISAKILAERIHDSTVAMSDTETKRDVMSLLLRARNVDLQDKGAYTMSDQAMVEQVVCFYLLSLRLLMLMHFTQQVNILGRRTRNNCVRFSVGKIKDALVVTSINNQRTDSLASRKRSRESETPS